MSRFQSRVPDDVLGRPAERRPAEIRRLILLFVIGLSMMGLLLAILNRIESNPGGGTLARFEPEFRKSPEDYVSPIGELTTPIAPWRPPVDALNAEIKEETQTDRVKVYPNAATSLAVLARNRAHLYFKIDRSILPEGGFDRIDPTKLFDPAVTPSLRGRPIELVGDAGATGTTAPNEFGLAPSEFPSQLLTGVLNLAGREIRWILLDDKNAQKLDVDMSVRLGGKTKVQGVFLRFSEESLPNGGGFVARPIVLAKKVVPVVPLRLEEELPSSVFDEASNIEATDIRLVPHRDPSFYRLLGYILNKGPLAIPKGAEVIELKTRAPLESPDNYRLKPVHYRGEVISLGFESFEYEEMTEADTPLFGYWHAIVSDGNPELNVPISLIIPEITLPPELEEWRKASPNERIKLPPPRIDVRGIFLRIHAFQARGGDFVRFPLVVAVERPVLVSRPPGADLQRLLPIFIGVLAALAAIVAIFVIRDRKKGLALEAHLRSQRLARRTGRRSGLNKPPGSSL